MNTKPDEEGGGKFLSSLLVGLSQEAYSANIDDT